MTNVGWRGAEFRTVVNPIALHSSVNARPAMIVRRLKLMRTYSDIHDIFQMGNRGNCVAFNRPAVCGTQAFVGHAKRVGNEDALTALKTDALSAKHIALVSDGVLVERLLGAVKSVVEAIAANGPLTARMIRKVAEKGNNISLKQPIH
jgi:hypothetical protein